MFKKIFFILSMVLTISLVPKHLMTAEAAKCSTKQECNAIISDAQSQISDIKKQQSSVQKEIDIVEGDMATTIEKISETESSISILH